MTRSRSAITLAAGAVAATFGLLMLPGLGVAHAQAAGAPVGPAPFDWASALTLTAVVLGGLGAILGGASVILHAVAPRTRTTVDDKLAAEVDAAHAKLDQVLGLLRGVVPGGLAPSSASVGGAAAPSSIAKAGAAATVALLAVVTGAGALMSGCTAAQRAEVRGDAATGVLAMLDCDAAHLDASTLADAQALADAKVQSWISGTPVPTLDALTAKIKADLSPIQTDWGRCLSAGALAAALAGTGAGAGSGAGSASAQASSAGAGSGASPHAAVQGLTAAASSPGAASATDPVQVRAAFSIAARELGWAPVRLKGGTVL